MKRILLAARSVNGEPTQIRKFEFKHLTAACNQGGPADVNDRIGKMKVDDAGKFDGKVSEGSGKVVVEGKTNDRGTKQHGTIRAKGRFAPAKGCDSGKVKWISE